MKPSTSSTRRALSGAALLGATLLLGCATSPVQNPMQMSPGFATAVQITVQNDDFKDAAVYANWQGSIRQRVGLVTGKTTQTFTMDWRSEVVRFEARLIAGETVFFDPIEVWGGDHLDLIIMNQG